MRRSDRGKNVVSSQKGSDNSSQDADTSLSIEQKTGVKKNSVKESTNEIKKRTMSGRCYTALWKNNNPKALVDVSNDKKGLSAGCSLYMSSTDDDAVQDGKADCPPSENSETKSLPLENGTDSILKSVRDTEMLNASAMVETGDGNAIGSRTESSETQNLTFSKTSVEINVVLPLKRKRDTAECELDACAIVVNGDDRIMSSDGVIPSLSGCKIDDEQVKESDHVEQDMEETEPATSRDYNENMQMQQDTVDEAGVEPSASVTAPVPSVLTNSMGQSAVQPVPQIPFPVFSDPFLHELEKLRRESEYSRNAYEEKKSVLKNEFERKIAELQAEYQRKLQEAEAEHNTKSEELKTHKNLIIMNKLLASAFLSECTEKKTSPSEDPRGRIQQLAQNALRNYIASTPAQSPLHPQGPSSVSRPSGRPLNSAVCPMPQPRQPLFSDPFLHELEKLRRESEYSRNAYEEKKSVLKNELERKIAELQAEYQRKLQEAEAEHNTKSEELKTHKNLIIMI